jgi:hypothetical protein
MGEIQVQDVFNEKKIIKLEVHQEAMPFGRQASHKTTIGR